MELHEMIQLRGNPFPKPLPMPASEIIAIFNKQGVTFQDEGGVLRFRGKYVPSTLTRIKQILSEHKLSAEVAHSVWTVYDEYDFTIAPLWLLLGIPEIWVSGIDFAVTCETCGRKRFQVNPEVRVQSVETRKPLLTVNGQFTIVRSDVARRIQKELKGATLIPFDRDGRYQYLLSERRLRRPIVSSDQAIGLKGFCNRCSSPIFEMFFGPLRYASNEWDGPDIVYCDFLSCNAYTPNAYDLLRKIEKNVAKDGIILLQ